MSGTFFCIYSGKDCPESQRSEEHIVPYAIGGPDSFTTNDVSKDANSTMGTSADAGLINDFRVALDRVRLGLAGQSGTVPSISLNGTVMIDGRERSVNYTINSGAPPTLNLHPKTTTQGRSVAFHCAPQDVRKVVRGLRKNLRKRNQDLDLSKTNFVTTVTKDPTVSIKGHLDPFAFHRGIVKMALGTAHLALGYGWSRSPYADTLRQCLSEPNLERWPRLTGDIPIAGVPEDVEELWGIGNSRHVLTLYNSPGLPLMFQCLLFGHVYGAIRLADGLWQADAVNTGYGLVFVIDCRARTLSRYTVLEFLQLRSEGAFRE